MYEWLLHNKDEERERFSSFCHDISQQIVKWKMATHLSETLLNNIHRHWQSPLLKSPHNMLYQIIEGEIPAQTGGIFRKPAVWQASSGPLPFVRSFRPHSPGQVSQPGQLSFWGILDLTPSVSLPTSHSSSSEGSEGAWVPCILSLSNSFCCVEPDSVPERKLSFLC